MCVKFDYFFANASFYFVCVSLAVSVDMVGCFFFCFIICYVSCVCVWYVRVSFVSSLHLHSINTISNIAHRVALFVFFTVTLFLRYFFFILLFFY